MTDSLKFGPEWLRNMKPENATSNITAMVTAPIKMAEFRYGREEMLALFDRTILAPDPLKQIQGLHVEKTQPPLALLQMTDEETRMWNRGINSDAVLRLTANKPGGPGSGPGAPGGGRGGVLGGRGGSVDRGRGRGRGTYHYSRGLSYEDSEGFNSSGSYSRNIRSFDRTQSQGSNQWSERNGGGLGVDHGDWSGGNMSTSPRKEYSGRSMSDTNWRRHRGAGEEEEGWRSTKHEKWTRGTSWRDGDSNWETNRGSSGSTRSWEDNSSVTSSRKPWEPEDNSLPEWATENPSDSGGSFDASGAFHGGGVYSDEDEDVNHSSGPTRGDTGRNNHTITNHRQTSSANKETSSNIVNGSSQIERIADRERNSKSNSNGNGPGLRQSQSASSLSSSGNTVPERKTSVPARSSTATNLAVLNTKTKPEPCEKVKEEDKIPEPSSPPKLKSFPQAEIIQPTVAPLSNERSEEAMLRMQEAADDLVAKLMDDEERDLPKTTAPTVQQSVPQNPSTVPSNTALADSDKWFYRDPQGTVQGPFLSSEMAEWYKSGYFAPTLQLRRACDERYSPLGDLMTLFGSIPFLVNTNIPPIKANDNLTALPTIPVSAAPPAPKSIDESLLLQQQYQYQQRQMLLSQQQALFKQLAQSERFNALSPLEQQQILLQQSANMDLGMLSGYIPAPPMPQPAPVPTPPQPHSNTQNSVIAMIQQLHQQQQQQAQVAAGIVPEPPHNPLAQQSIDPVQLIQQIGGLQAQSALLPQPQIHQKQLEDQRCIEQLLNLFANVRKTTPHNNAQPPPPRSQTVKQVESVWGGTAATGPNYSPNWPLPPAPPGQLPSSLWGELHSKGMKTEQEILEEQLRMEEERKKEERRKQEELQRIKEEMEEEEERARRRREEAEALEKKRKEEDEREKRRLKEEEEKKKQEAAAKKAEQERLRKEEEKKKKEEEKKRKEELKRKQEDEKRKQEEEKKRQEEEKKKQEEENKRAEQAKRQAEALKRLQEQQQQAQARAVVKPSMTPAWVAPEAAATSTSLTEIQKTERKQQQLLREQQILQLVQQQQQQQQERNNNNKSGSSLNLKWAETKKPQTRVKSLAEIQAEEQEQLAKQTEREKAERMAQAKEVPLPAASSIWANQNLTWNTQNSSSVWGSSTATGGSSSGPGFWEEVAPISAPKPANKSKPSNSGGATTAAANKPVATKNRAKKDEMTVLKLFEQQPKFDEFYNWCSKSLSTMQSSVDIPTFVQFLREIEHPYEVHEYVRMYLGEGKDASDFATQFIDRRSRAKTGAPQKRTENSTAAPTNHFQEVKGKNKKVKKGKMLRVDNRILGFSVTASQDRFNVGDRDYGENI